MNLLSTFLNKCFAKVITKNNIFLIFVGGHSGSPSDQLDYTGSSHAVINNIYLF